MGAIIMHSQNSKTSNPYRLIILNFTDKINVKRTNKYVALANLSMYNTWKNKKGPQKQ